MLMYLSRAAEMGGGGGISFAPYSPSIGSFRAVSDQGHSRPDGFVVSGVGVRFTLLVNGGVLVNFRR